MTTTLPEAGLGALTTERGNLPLHRLDVHAAITGLTARTELVQGFGNPHDEPLEATYAFPLPDRAAVTGMRMIAGGREIVAQLQERGAARQAYDEAIQDGHRAAIAEEDRPDVFTMRVGNIAPGERVEVHLTLVGPLAYSDDDFAGGAAGEATYRFPLVVAPRYIPGVPSGVDPAGAGVVADTDRVPDASRITPPVLLPGFPNPVALSIEVALDPAGLPLTGVESSLHRVVTDDDRVVRIEPGERVDRDFVLRLRFDGAALRTSLACVPDGDGGTFQLTIVPPASGGTDLPRDVVLLLDRSGSMGGWKMVAARRAAARIVDTLGAADRFAVRTFDHTIETPDGLPPGLVPASDRHRFRAVEHLSRAEARGGTELLAPLREGLALLATDASDRRRVLVLVTDGQVGNEDEILAAAGRTLGGVRIHTVGIDRAVNAGFLGRLASLGRGRCELVESEDRLDAAMAAIHRRIATPLLTELSVTGGELAEVSPDRRPDVFPGVPLVLCGRYVGAAPELEVRGTTPDGTAWTTTVAPEVGTDPAVPLAWARARLRDLEDAYAMAPDDALEQRIVETSLRHGVLCRFTAYVAVDPRTTTDGATPHRIIQPVELPSGWDPRAWGGPVPAAPGGAIMRSPVPTASRAPRRTSARRSAGFMVPESAGSTPAMDTAAWMSAPTAEPDDPSAPADAELRRTLERERQALVDDPATAYALDDLATRLEALVAGREHDDEITKRVRAIVEVLRDASRGVPERAERAAAALGELLETSGRCVR